MEGYRVFWRTQWSMEGICSLLTILAQIDECAGTDVGNVNL